MNNYLWFLGPFTTSLFFSLRTGINPFIVHPEAAVWFYVHPVQSRPWKSGAPGMQPVSIRPHRLLGLDSVLGQPRASFQPSLNPHCQGFHCRQCKKSTTSCQLPEDYSFLLGILQILRCHQSIFALTESSISHQRLSMWLEGTNWTQVYNEFEPSTVKFLTWISPVMEWYQACFT